MALTIGTRLGPYEVTTQIGVGGMGEVYRGRDTRLKRDVALKVLPDSVANDPDRLARFQREAEVLASLNHPNIAAIHGLEESNGTRALVMELVEGPTLADRIAQGPISLDEALPIAKQIAEALEAAHEQGIIHRDLKPANIKVRPDGTVKVLDFGLAKALENAPGTHIDATASPTITSPAMMTGVGMLLGTAAYMSPEQARGRAVDRRTDIWAFGCVLYEMLSGKRAFVGGDVTDTLAAVLRSEPQWDCLPSATPPIVGAFLRRCLHKDWKQRTGDIRDVRLALEGAFDTSVSPRGTTVAHGGRLAVLGVTALCIGALVAGAAVWYLTRPEPPRIVRSEITPSGSAALNVNDADRDLAITPDGSRIVYRGENGLLVRALDQLTPTVLTGLNMPRGVFISPDSQWVGFVDLNMFKKVAITGGPPIALTASDGIGPRGATWGDDDTIIYATAAVDTGLRRIPAGGGQPTLLTTPQRERGEEDHVWPEFLPGSRAVLFTILPTTGGLENASIAVLDFRTHAQTVLLRGGHHAHYVPSGHLVYGAGGTLRAVAFDRERLTVIGNPVPVVEQVLTTPVGAVDAVVATNGTLAYVLGGTASVARTLVWVDRQGREEPVNAPPRAYSYAQLSPDGTRVALDIRDQEQDIWIWDLTRGALQRLSFDSGRNRGPLWSRDGRRVAFSRPIGNGEEIYWQTADGSGNADPLTTDSKRPMGPSDFSPDGLMLLYQPTAQPTDIWMVPVKGPPTAATPLLNSAANEGNAAVSPDGRWLAYQSDESGQFEIYVRPFPDVTNGRWQISTGGGTRPRWSRDGRELFYYVATRAQGTFMAVSVGSGASFVASTPRMLFQGPYPAPNAGRALYDVSGDGQRFLVIKTPAAERGAVGSRQIIVVQNWQEELKRLVPTR